MTISKDNVIRMWKEAGDLEIIGMPYAKIEAFAKLVAENAIADEREACAKLVEVPDDVEDWEIICGDEGRYLLNAMAGAIRARGNK